MLTLVFDTVSLFFPLGSGIILALFLARIIIPDQGNKNHLSTSFNV